MAGAVAVVMIWRSASYGARPARAAQNESEPALRATITTFWHYQTAGLTALFRHLAQR